MLLICSNQTVKETPGGKSEPLNESLHHQAAELLVAELEIVVDLGLEHCIQDVQPVML